MRLRSAPRDAVGEQLDAQRPLAEQAVARRRAPRGRRAAPGSPAACCSASTSVGAISAPWWPPCTAASRAVDGDDRLAGADVALQQPVHRVRRRRGRRRSRAMTRRWAPVSGNGRRGVEARRTSSPPTTWRMPDGVALQRPLAHARAPAAPAAARRTPAGGGPAPCRPIVSGRWMSCSARSRSIRPSRRRTRRGHRVGDAPRLGTARSASSTQPAISHVVELGLLRLRVDRHDAARCGRRSGRRPGSSSAGRPGTRRPCRTARPAGPACSWRSRHGWLKNTTLQPARCRRRPTASTIVRRLRGRRACAPSAPSTSTSASSPGREVADPGLVGAVDPAAGVVGERGRATVSTPTGGSASRLRSPTPFSRADGDVGQLAAA